MAASGSRLCRDKLMRSLAARTCRPTRDDDWHSDDVDQIVGFVTSKCLGSQRHTSSITRLRWPAVVGGCCVADLDTNPRHGLFHNRFVPSPASGPEPMRRLSVYVRGRL